MLTAIGNLDGGVLLWLQSLRVSWLDLLAAVYTGLGDRGWLWIALSLVMLCYRPTRKAGALALVSMALGALCTNVVLKPLVARPRPWLDVEGLVPLISEGDFNSFPSGHTCAAFAAAMAWRKNLPKRWMGNAGLVMAVCMGLSRLYVGVHYPSDVMAGALIGTVCAWTVTGLYPRWSARLPNRKRDRPEGDGAKNKKE